MKHLFVVNPVAGGKKNHIEGVVADIEAAAKSFGGDYDIYVTKGPMDACTEIRRRAADGGEYRVYACGGDGTLNECVNGAAGLPNVSVTHYPCGTGNDFVKMFGADAARFGDICTLMGGEIRPTDIIDCGERCGINICSVGIDARIGTDVHKYSAIPVIGGATGYVASLAVNIMRGINQKLTIKTPETELSGDFALLCACNGRFYGGGFNPVPEARPDDGMLDILAVGAVNVIKFLSMVGRYAKGRYKELGELVTHLKTTEIRIIADTELVVNVDGEAIYGKDITFRVIRGGVNFIYPRDMAFFG